MKINIYYILIFSSYSTVNTLLLDYKNTNLIYYTFKWFSDWVSVIYFVMSWQTLNFHGYRGVLFRILESEVWFTLERECLGYSSTTRWTSIKLAPTSSVSNPLIVLTYEAVKGYLRFVRHCSVLLCRKLLWNCLLINFGLMLWIFIKTVISHYHHAPIMFTKCTKKRFCEVNIAREAMLLCASIVFTPS
jgi:hypothetical protein